MKRILLIIAVLLVFADGSAQSAEGSMKEISRYFAYFVCTPEGEYKTMNLWYQRQKYVGKDGKEYLQYGGYFDNGYTMDSLVMLRQEGTKCFCLDTKSNMEHLIFDFGLFKGDTYFDSLNDMKYVVTDIRDSIVGDESLRLIELKGQGGMHDIWLEGIGSVYTGIMRGANVSLGDAYLVRVGGNRFYPSNQYVKTADICVTELVWDGKLETSEDWEAYRAWNEAPSDLNGEFVGDTLHVWGRLHTSCDILPYAMCGLRDSRIEFMVYSNGEVDCYSNYEIDAKIPGFKAGTYEVGMPGQEFVTLECKGIEEESHQPLPFLEGNPIWVYKYEHMPRPRIPYSHCWVDTGDRSFTYYFLGKQKEIDGKLYTMMGEITSRGDDELYVNRWYPIREENGIVYTITDSLPEILELKYVEDYEIPYLQQGNECVLYNFSAEIGDKLDERNVVESFDTYQLMDGTECRVLKTGTHYDLYEKLGYRDDDGTYGLIDPFLGLLTSTNGHAYTKRLNAYYQDNTMLYRAPDAPEGLCVNDTIWTSLDDACIYASSYKADPRQEEVFSYIQQLQTANEPVTFAAGQTATIILPTVPDASKGKYYRLDRCENGQIVFEQELHPQARTPYIIVPDEDFSIDPITLDLAGLSRDTVAIGGISFIGSYVRTELPASTGGEGSSSYIDIIDLTPDCGLLPSEETGQEAFLIGALRAYLIVNWDDPIYYGGTRGKQEKLRIVLKDDGTGIDGIQNSEFKNQNEEGSIIYDLSGRMFQKIQKGVNIVNGKKVAVK